jgi:hypothetical protein
MLGNVDPIIAEMFIAPVPALTGSEYILSQSRNRTNTLGNMVQFLCQPWP